MAGSLQRMCTLQADHTANSLFGSTNSVLIPTSPDLGILPGNLNVLLQIPLNHVIFFAATKGKPAAHRGCVSGLRDVEHTINAGASCADVRRSQARPRNRASGEAVTYEDWFSQGLSTRPSEVRDIVREIRV